MTRLLRPISQLSIVAQLGLVLVVAQVLAHAITVIVMLWRFGEPGPETFVALNVAKMATVAELASTTSGPERAAILEAARRVQPAIWIIGDQQLRAGHGAFLVSTAVITSVSRFAPSIPAGARFVEVSPDLANPKPGDDLLALSLGDGTSMVFPINQAMFDVPFKVAVIGLSIAMLIVSILAIALWAVGTLTAPLRRVVAVADRFAVDLDATPMKAQGSAEIRTLVHAFNAMRDRIRDLIDSRSRMLAAVSHDLRTPLTRIRLRVETMTDGEDRTRILRDLKSMDVMIGQALSYLRDQTSAMARDRVNLAILIETICTDFSDADQPASFTSPRNVVITCEPDLLTRALSNLIENAVKFGGSAQVSLETRSPAEVAILVDDEGPGIVDAEKLLALEPFSRGDKARGESPSSGFGLGLAIARQIVERHGGSLTLIDRAPKGLRVQVLLPVERLDGQSPKAPTLAPPRTAAIDNFA